MLIPELPTIERLHRKYAPNDETFQLVYGHCQVVAEIALWCADNLTEQVDIDRDLLRAAALLHDIATYGLLGADSAYYTQHAILGAALLSEEGLDSQMTDIVKTHVLLGLSRQEIQEQGWHLPDRDYFPTSIEGEILCYADRFHSKRPVFNGYVNFLANLRKELPHLPSGPRLRGPHRRHRRIRKHYGPRCPPHHNPGRHDGRRCCGIHQTPYSPSPLVVDRASLINTGMSLPTILKHHPAVNSQIRGRSRRRNMPIVVLLVERGPERFRAGIVLLADVSDPRRPTTRDAAGPAKENAGLRRL